MRPRSPNPAACGIASLFAVALASGPGRLVAQDPGVRGSWDAREYVLASGATHQVRGQIHFSASDWLVLFFVMDGERAARASAEGGSYMLEGDRLTFEHLHHLSVGDALEGLPESPLRMETRAAAGPLEPARAVVENDRLTLHFPSGNRMTFVRGSPP
ncbi:MAG: hypothetical protein R3195_19445 [Gemmatimonadota bacterium]|nr:hypothetical protein [Gemmatimonadota bacterium]